MRVPDARVPGPPGRWSARISANISANIPERGDGARLKDGARVLRLHRQEDDGGLRLLELLEPPLGRLDARPLRHALVLFKREDHAPRDRRLLALGADVLRRSRARGDDQPRPGAEL